MKFFLSTALIILVGVSMTMSTTYAADKAQDKSAMPENILGAAVSPAEKADAVRAIDSYVYSRPPSSESLKLYDPVGENVATLTLESIHGDSARRLDRRNLAIPAHLTNAEGGKYKVWFVVGPDTEKETVVNYFRKMKVSGLEQFRVKDVVIQAVNGKQQFDWKETESGWTIQR